MNYIVQINEFWDLAEEKRLSAKQMILYFALLDRANRLGWQEWICIPNTVLAEAIRLTVDDVRNSRKRLIQCGLIEFKQGGHKQAGNYKIINRQTTAKLPLNDRQETTENDSEIQGNIDDENKSYRQTTAKLPPSNRIYKTININNKHKLNKNINTICPKTDKPEVKTRSNIGQIENQKWFDEIYAIYPKHVKRTVAYESFVKLKPDEDLVETIKKHIGRLKKSEDWLKDGGKYVPMLSTYLNQKRWTDDINVDDEKYFISKDNPFYEIFGEQLK